MIEIQLATVPSFSPINSIKSAKPDLNKVDYTKKSIPQLSYIQTMIAGAISRTLAQTLLHPVNTYKTLLQIRHKEKSMSFPLSRLLHGIDAQFLLSLPHGAFHFFVIDQINTRLLPFLPVHLLFLSDFLSSTISTVVCSLVSTPQMVLTDRLMAGVYPSLPAALASILAQEGMMGLYSGWAPALAQKIPTSGLTWMFFQQLKRLFSNILPPAPPTLHTASPSRSASLPIPLPPSPHPLLNFFLGAGAAAASVLCLIPLDTIKTRLVVQTPSTPSPYRGIWDCFLRVWREEGLAAFYRSLGLRLLSVVPMVAIQYGVYEAIKTRLLKEKERDRENERDRQSQEID